MYGKIKSIDELIDEEINCPHCREGLTFREIGEMLKISEQRVEQIFKVAMKKMRKDLIRKGFKRDDF